MILSEVLAPKFMTIFETPCIRGWLGGIQKGLRMLRNMCDMHGEKKSEKFVEENIFLHVIIFP